MISPKMRDVIRLRRWVKLLQEHPVLGHEDRVVVDRFLKTDVAMVSLEEFGSWDDIITRLMWDYRIADDG